MDKKLLNRIRRCLALSASSNEHEAAAALAKARQLMAEHGITEEVLAMAEIEEALAQGAGTASPALWQRHLVAVVRRALAVEAFLDAGHWRFVGHGPSAEIAAYAFASLFRRLKGARAEYVRTTLKRCSLARKRVRADAFCEGWAAKLFDKVARLAPRRANDAAIAGYLAIHHPGLVPCRAARSGASAQRVLNDYSRGFVAGSAVDLNHGVGGSAPQPVLA